MESGPHEWHWGGWFGGQLSEVWLLLVHWVHISGLGQEGWVYVTKALALVAVNWFLEVFMDYNELTFNEDFLTEKMVSTFRGGAHYLEGG